MDSKSGRENADKSKASDSTTTIGNDKDIQSAVEQSTTPSSKQSKVKSKSKRSKDANVADDSSTTSSSSGSSGNDGATGQLNTTQLEAVLKNNPALKSELEGLDAEKLREKMKGMGIEDLLTGTVRVLLIFNIVLFCGRVFFF